MLNQSLQNITKAYDSFTGTLSSIMPIQDEESYEQALVIAEQLFDELDDSGIDPKVYLLNIVADQIERYEYGLPEMQEFLAKANELSSDNAVLKLIMTQNHLSAADLIDEIGSKSLVSLILKGDRNLTKTHIGKLCDRFHLAPTLFF